MLQSYKNNHAGSQLELKCREAHILKHLWLFPDETIILSNSALPLLTGKVSESSCHFTVHSFLLEVLEISCNSNIILFNPSCSGPTISKLCSLPLGRSELTSSPRIISISLAWNVLNYWAETGKCIFGIWKGGGVVTLLVSYSSTTSFSLIVGTALHTCWIQSPALPHIWFTSRAEASFKSFAPLIIFNQGFDALAR